MALQALKRQPTIIVSLRDRAFPALSLVPGVALRDGRAFAQVLALRTGLLSQRPWRDEGAFSRFPALRTGLLSSVPSGTEAVFIYHSPRNKLPGYFHWGPCPPSFRDYGGQAETDFFSDWRPPVILIASRYG